METTRILNRSRTRAQTKLNNNFDNNTFDAILHFDVALIVAEIPIINNEENSCFITNYIQNILYSQATQQHKLNIIYLINKIIFYNIWWLEVSESTLKFNKVLL